MLGRFLCVAGTAFLMAGAAMAADIPTEKITLRGVDKVTGHVKTFVATVGQPLTFGSLTVLPEKCLARSQEETPENSAFLTITEQNAKGVLEPVFTGWMFSSNPALSAMEHPIYDIWVLNCVTSWNTLPGGAQLVAVADLSEEELRAINEEDNPSLGDEVIPETTAVVPVPVSDER